jgi:2,4-dienoyl-CoA reductase-like NADH-dependent reductase (Old Yellow Enzyme family)
MPDTPAFVRIPSLKTVDAFRAHAASLGLELPCDDVPLAGSASPLGQPVPDVEINGKRIANRWVVQPMEGWDGTPTGGVTDDVCRRWERFGASGAKLICGGEAMAVRPDGRANPNQLVLVDANKRDLAYLRDRLVRAHEERHAGTGPLVIGFQLTHSGRFCRPNNKLRFEPRVAVRHPILDRRFHVTRDDQVMTDDDVQWLIEDYARAARIAWDVGADFVDLKHCHGYLLHEFLGAHTRSGRFGGSFENRTRILRDLVDAIRSACPRLDLAVRLSAFDTVPFQPDPARSRPGRPGPGIPEDYQACLPYRYGFGVNADDPLAYDLAEPIRFLQLCAELGVRLVNLSAGSPYYNPHLQRPAAYPPSDGYQPPEDPLVGVGRQIAVVRQLKAAAPAGLVLVGSAYSYLQDYLPHVAQAVVRAGWTDLVGIGRMVLSYPTLPAELIAGRPLNPRLICRTFSDCTTAPRNGLVSGCYPLDDHYRRRPEAAQLKQLKQAAG